MKSKKLITSLLTLSMLASTIVPAYAAETNEVVDPLPGTGYSKITVEVKDNSGGGGDSDIIIATVPVELPIIMDLEGNVTVPTDAKIINHVEDKGIKVTDVSITLDPSWSAANFSDDFTAKADNTKELGLSFRGDTLNADGTFPITEGNWNIAKNSNLPLNMAAKLPKHTIESKTQAATVGFTIDWSGLDGTDGGSDPDAGKDNSGGSGEVNPPEAWDTNPMTSDEITALNLSFDSSTGAIKALKNTISGEINIPTSVDGVKVTAIGVSGFQGCSYLAKVTIPDSVTTIEGNAFYGCTTLTSITIPDSITTIGQFAFTNCTSLKSITIPDSVTSIGQYAFDRCTGSTNIVIPDSVTSIGSNAFYNVPHITYNGTATGRPWGALSMN